jgi:imidazole glycerol-phosphate synthase subunit HisH
MKLVIIDYKAGNISSVKHALRRLGAESILSSDPEIISSADKIIFPGVGEASSAMKALRERGLDLLIPKLKQPVLGICLGMQLLCESSEEGNTSCLGVFPVQVRKFRQNQGEKIPHVGWNNISTFKSGLFNGLKENEQVYFVHTYYAGLSLHTTSTCSYIHDFSASLAKDNFEACQFHPEKSGEAGEIIVRNFLAK